MKNILIGAEHIIESIALCESTIKTEAEKKSQLIKTELAEILTKNFLASIQNPLHKRFFMASSLENFFEGEVVQGDTSILFALCQEIQFDGEKNKLVFNASCKEFYIGLEEIAHNGIPTEVTELRVFVDQIVHADYGIVPRLYTTEGSFPDLGKHATFYFDLVL